MKQHYLLSVALLIMLAACKKDKSDDYYLSLTVDGKNIVYDYDAPVHIEKRTDGDMMTTIRGITFSTDKPLFYIQLVSPQPIATGIYTDTTLVPWVSTQLSYDNDLYYDAGTSWALYNTDPDFKHFTLHITAIGNGTISGTFEGTLYKKTDTTSFERTITNGSFYLQTRE
jgi:hypothetical protein